MKVDNNDKKGYALQINQKRNKEFASLELGVSQHLLDTKLTFLWANAFFYQSVGYSQDEFQTKYADFQQFFSEDIQSFEKLSNCLMDGFHQGAHKMTCDIPLPVKKNDPCHMRLTATLRNEPGMEPIIDILYTEIGDLYQEQKCLKADHNKIIHNLEWLMSEFTGNIYISDIHTYEVLYLNKAICQTLHAKEEELIGRKCYEVIQGRNSPCPFCTNAKLSKEKVFEWEFKNPSLDTTFMLKDKLINWNGHEARIELAHDTFSTEYKLAKKDRERDAIIRTIPGGFARVDARDMRTILWYGGGFLDLIGYTKKQFEEELHAQCNYVHPDELEMAIAIMEKSKYAGKDTIFEGRIITRDGDIKILMMTFSYVKAEDSWDGIPSFYSVGLDVTNDRTEQQRQQKALQEAYETSRQASQAKTDFLSSMSHDIRTPMNAIMGMTTIAEANLNSIDKVRNCLDKIQISSRHLLSLINEVLDMSKIESGKIDLTQEDVDLAELTDTIYVMSKSLIGSKKLNFKIIIGKICHEKVKADGDRLRQILMNLLSNAVKYTPEGGNITLAINENDSTAANKSYYEFIVEDDGIGMHKEFLAHIFEPFSRAEDTRISKIQGTGLGMAISENIIRMMNGTIEVYSEVGKGSRFIVSIPLILQNKDQERVEELIGKSVLVADDDEIVCENAVLLLRELGIKGTWVQSGLEAIQELTQKHDQQQDYDAVILDWKMPEMNGLDTIRIIRKKLWKKIPIIVISAYDLSDIEEDFIEAGADAFISKPLFKSKLLHVLEQFCVNNTYTKPIPKKELPKDGRGKHILLAEDNELNREIAIELLSIYGFIIDAAQNGEEAIAMFSQSETNHYAAILMDIQMPIMNGYQACENIRKLHRQDAQSIPIIALSANVFVSDIKQAQVSGMNDYIAKPIHIDEMIKTLKKYLS